MKKLLFSSILLFFFSFCCLVAYKASPNYIDEQGFLHEAFGFILLGYLFFFAGTIIGIITLTQYLRQK